MGGGNDADDDAAADDDGFLGRNTDAIARPSHGSENSPAAHHPMPTVICAEMIG